MPFFLKKQMVGVLVLLFSTPRSYANGHEKKFQQYFREASCKRWGMMFIVAVLMLAFLIFVHELGHFTIARICGVKVEVFSIGFGKKLCFFKLFGTQFALSLIPLGGYVKLKGMDKEENGTNETHQADDSYAQKSPFQKLWILFC